MTEKPLHVQVAERIKSRITVLPTGCWGWKGYKDRKGYGRFSLRNRPTIVARASYEAFIGPIPTGLTIDHLCRQRACVNPNHLEPVTRGENVLRGETITGRNKRAIRCPKGHPYDSNNTSTDKRGRRSCKTCRRAWWTSSSGRKWAREYRRNRRALGLDR